VHTYIYNFPITGNRMNLPNSIVQRIAHSLKTHTIVSGSLLDTSCWTLRHNFLELLKITLFHSLHLLLGLSKQVFLPLSVVLPEKSKDTILQIMSQSLAPAYFWPNYWTLWSSTWHSWRADRHQGQIAADRPAIATVFLWFLLSSSGIMPRLYPRSVSIWAMATSFLIFHIIIH
jgi:hypothetical protein